MIFFNSNNYQLWLIEKNLLKDVSLQERVVEESVPLNVLTLIACHVAGQDYEYCHLKYPWLDKSLGEFIIEWPNGVVLCVVLHLN